MTNTSMHPRRSTSLTEGSDRRTSTCSSTAQQAQMQNWWTVRYREGGGG